MAILHELAITIDDGETVSDLIDTKGYDVVGVEVPADFDGAALTFKGCTLKTDTAQAINFEGTAFAPAVAASERLTISAEKCAASKHIQVVSDAAQSGADAVMKLLCREFAR